ncbi:MAG: hypothetical protein ABR583_11290 [Gaiellaceae bacterium]
MTRTNRYLMLCFAAMLGAALLAAPAQAYKLSDSGAGGPKALVAAGGSGPAPVTGDAGGGLAPQSEPGGSPGALRAVAAGDDSTGSLVAGVTIVLVLGAAASAVVRRRGHAGLL